jgi:hypothetical protein
MKNKVKHMQNTTTHATKSNISWSLLNFPITRNEKQASLFCHQCNECCYLPISRAVIQLWIWSNLCGIPLYTSYYSKEDWLSKSRFYYSKSAFLLITFTSVIEIQNHTALTLMNFWKCSPVLKKIGSPVLRALERIWLQKAEQAFQDHVYLER